MYPELPIKIDVFAILMLLGVVQGFFLAVLFLTIQKGNRLTNRYFGLLLLAMSLTSTEILLGYTNYMFHTLYLDDAAEPLDFVLAPLTFLYIKAYLDEKFKMSHLLHFIPFILYLIYMLVLVYPEGEIYKYNSYIDSFHPEMKRLPYHHIEEAWYYCFRNNVNELMFWQLLIYLVADFIMVYEAFRKEGLSFFSSQNKKLTWCRTQVISLASIVIVFLIAKKMFQYDLGDHIIAAHISLIIYAISFSVISRSGFFHENPSKTLKKYEKSSLTADIQDNTLTKLVELMEKEKPFLDSTFSLPNLAKMLSVSPHHLSQILNESLGQSFFDFAAEYRIKEARVLLSSDQNNHLKIEEIAERVGYNSKSAFNTSFKKIVGVTPSQFRAQY